MSRGGWVVERVLLLEVEVVETAGVLLVGKAVVAAVHMAFLGLAVDEAAAEVVLVVACSESNGEMLVVRRSLLPRVVVVAANFDCMFGAEGHFWGLALVAEAAGLEVVAVAVHHLVEEAVDDIEAAAVEIGHGQGMDVVAVLGSIVGGYWSVVAYSSCRWSDAEQRHFHMNPAAVVVPQMATEEGRHIYLVSVLVMPNLVRRRINQFGQSLWVAEAVDLERLVVIVYLCMECPVLIPGFEPLGVEAGLVGELSVVVVAAAVFLTSPVALWQRHRTVSIGNRLWTIAMILSIQGALTFNH